jgi:hypothetical protein
MQNHSDVQWLQPRSKEQNEVSYIRVDFLPALPDCSAVVESITSTIRFKKLTPLLHYSSNDWGIPIYSLAIKNGKVRIGLIKHLWFNSYLIIAITSINILFTLSAFRLNIFRISSQDTGASSSFQQS